MTETERKFLVSDNRFIDLATQKSTIAQGYLNTHPERTVRVRIKGGEAFLTIKGKSNQSGLSRFEWEKPIELDEARILLGLCEPGVIEKTRYLVPAGYHKFEVDVFEGENLGLVIAEIELSSEDETHDVPDWLGPEVTGQAKYYNANLIKNPFLSWEE